MDKITEMLKGVLEGCILQIISRDEVYGYQITKELNELGFNDVVDGTVYTILLRLEKNGLVDTFKRPSTKGPARKFYVLNDAGKTELKLFWNKWEYMSDKLNILKGE